MSDTVLDDYASIGRRSVPRSVTDVPASGVYWTGPTRFVVREERPGAFRWLMVSGDGRELQLAQSPVLFPTGEECRKEVTQLDPTAAVSFEYTAPISKPVVKPPNAKASWAELDA